MELLEVVVQGVSGASDPVRWSFAQGASVVPAAEAEQRLACAAFELLSGITDGATSRALLPGAEGRIAVVVVGRDQQRYRLLWDLTSGRRALQKHDGEKFAMVSTVAAEIAQALTAQVGFPQPDALREIFFSFTEDLASSRVRVPTPTSEEQSSSKAERPLPPGFGDASGPSAHADKPLPPGFDFEAAPTTSKWLGRPEAELRARLAELDAQASAGDDVSALEFELDGLQKKVFELNERRRPIQQAEQELQGLDRALQQVAFLESLPADFEAQVVRLERLRAGHERELATYDDERERLEKQAEHLSDDVSGIRERPRPMQAAAGDPLVRYGLIGGVAAIMLGLAVGAVNETARYLALLDIPAFGVAVFGGIRLLSGLEEGASIRARLARVARDKKRAMDRFQIDEEQVTRLLQKANLTVEQLPDVRAQLGQRGQLIEAHATAKARLAEATSSGDAQALAAEIGATEARMREVEEKLAAAGMGQDPSAAMAMQTERSEILRILSGELTAASDAAGPAPSASFGAPTPSRTFGAGVEADGDEAVPQPVDVAQLMVRLASDLLVTSVDDAATRLAPRASQMLQALTNGRFTELRFGSKASAQVVESTTQAVMPFVQLPPGDRDLACLALRLAIVESVVKLVGRLPVVFDRVFDVMPTDRHPLLIKAVQFLAAGTQVIVVTTRRELASAGTLVQGQRVAPTGAR